VKSESGSAVAEFVMVSALLVVLCLSVLQLGLALLIRNTLIDAAAEGARFAALADTSFAEGAERASALIATAIGPDYARDISVTTANYLGHPAVVVTVRAPLPLLGLVGLDNALEVSGHAAVESLD